MTGNRDHYRVELSRVQEIGPLVARDWAPQMYCFRTNLKEELLKTARFSPHFAHAMPTLSLSAAYTLPECCLHFA